MYKRKCVVYVMCHVRQFFRVTACNVYVHNLKNRIFKISKTVLFLRRFGSVWLTQVYRV